MGDFHDDRRDRDSRSQSGHSGTDTPKYGQPEPESDGSKPQGLVRKDGYYTFLLVGTDKGGGNTDTMLLVSFDTSNKKINLLQIPRDTLLNVDRAVKKINAAYAYGKIDGLKQDISNLLGVPVDRYGILNITGFHKVVDAVACGSCGA